MSDPVSAADRTLLVRLNRRSRAGIEELCDDLGVTATAVRQRLARLTDAGLIDRRPVSVGRGRPRHLYGLTPDGRRALGSNYQELADAMWSALSEVEDEKVRAFLFGRLQDTLVSRYGGDSAGEGELLQRLAGLRDALEVHGFTVEIDDSGPLPILREHHCPYLDISEDDPQICELEQRVFERVLGTGVSLTRCCRDGDSCCEFTPEGPALTHLSPANAGVTP
ncbi:helix-turn-helix transcriptional regulator [Alienimonas californiensis]|uniref:Uncharacterized protein n=1 Tax=Alienimonas californiensis TaxID=2527989 RepID=A0A517PDS4_9PLAN|nr:winged helix-turn-helix transcriptional regulator [Alienimonas californiensis]QDT17533.1 hypothetical protein CA12_36600 [Alienimonas californiensis]